MNLLRHHGLYWDDRLRWYERGGLVVWWLGQFLFGTCFVLALAVVGLTGFDRAGIDSAMACLLAGFAILFATRFLLVLALRKRRRRGVRLWAGLGDISRSADGPERVDVQGATP